MPWPFSFPSAALRSGHRAARRRLAFAAAVAIACGSAIGEDAVPPAATDDAIRAFAKAELPKLLELYCHLHAHPELSLQEKETAARMAEEFGKAGFEVTPAVGGHGVVGVLRNGPGKTVMLRTDLDALPVVEKTLLPYASQVRVKDDQDKEVGTMHACGHDVHMTSLVGTARYLAAHKGQWRGTVVLVGQPAEERVMGAKAMLDDGLFTRFPRPDFALAMHCDAALAAGLVGCRAGYALANTDAVEVTLHGRGGHGAYPHTTVDPIVEAAQFVLALQTIVAREVKPTEPAVVTVGSIHAGTTFNIISDRCDLQMTVRSYSDEVRQQLLAAIERKAKGIAMASGADEPTVRVIPGTPALYNDDALNARVESVFRRVFGAPRVTLGEQSMGGEDFGRFGKAGVPIVMFRLGTVAPARLERMTARGESPPSLHSAQFYPDPEPTLETGVVALTAAALDLLAAEAKP